MSNPLYRARQKRCTPVRWRVHGRKRSRSPQGFRYTGLVRNGLKHSMFAARPLTLFSLDLLLCVPWHFPFVLNSHLTVSVVSSSDTCRMGKSGRNPCGYGRRRGLSSSPSTRSGTRSSRFLSDGVWEPSNLRTCTNVVFTAILLTFLRSHRIFARGFSQGNAQGSSVMHVWPTWCVYSTPSIAGTGSFSRGRFPNNKPFAFFFQTT